MDVRDFLSCGNCRKAKPVDSRVGDYTCKTKVGQLFWNNFSNTNLCNEWLPTKLTTKVWVERLKEENRRNEQLVKKQNGGQYALITKHRVPRIIIMSNNMDDFVRAIVTLYHNKKALQSKGEKYEMGDMMKDYKKVKIIITEIT